MNKVFIEKPEGWIPGKGRSKWGGLVNLERCEAGGRMCRGEMLATCQTNEGPMCLVLRCWEFIPRHQRTFGQFLRFLDMLPCSLECFENRGRGKGQRS